MGTALNHYCINSFFKKYKFLSKKTVDAAFCCI